MGREDFLMIEDCDKTDKSAAGKKGDTSIFLVEETFSCTPKNHLHLGDLPKENSFSSTDSDSSTDEIKRSKIKSFYGFIGLFLALLACMCGCYVMWATDLFMVIVHQNLIISNNSMRYEAWKTPPVNAFLRVYIFNYTNVHEFESGLDTKLKVQELGPYTYIEKWERVDVKFNENGTATYRDRRTYKFSPEHSKGNESDLIIVPNVPFLSAVTFLKNLSFLVRWSVTKAISVIGGKPFIRLNASEFLWGYEDEMSKITQRLLSFQYDLPFKKFGILSAKNGTQKDLVTIYTGEEDPTKTGIVVNYDGKTALNYWSTEECNRIDGTDGTIYPPAMVHLNSTLYIYSKDLCRKMPLIYDNHYEDKHGIPVMRFRVPESVFASGHKQKENLCFCSHAGSQVECLPSGVFNVGPCAFEAPLVTSMPHFLYGDSILLKGVEGLEPVVDKHETFVEVDPSMGIPVGGKSRLQLNIMLSKSSDYGNRQRNTVYKNEIVLPITWMDYGIDRLPEKISWQIRSLLAFIKAAQFSLSYGFIICSMVFGILLINRCRQSVRDFGTTSRCKRQRKETQSETPLFSVTEKL